MTTSSSDFIVLHGTAVSLVLEADGPGAPLWRHFGARLPDIAPAPGRLRAERFRPTFSLDDDVPFSLFPTFGQGWFGAPALLAHRDGRDFAQAFTPCDWHWIRPGQAVRVTLTDAVAGLTLAIDLDLDPATDVLSTRARLTNSGPTPLDVTWLAAMCLPLPGEAAQVRHMSGRHNGEFALQVDPLGRGTWSRENRRGLTSHDCPPVGVVVLPGATEHAGPAYGAQLAWSGNHAQRIDRIDDGRFQWQMGEWLAPGEGRLPPGATMETPEALATFSPHGLNGVAANFHAAIRARMTWPGGSMAPRPVHLNTWEGVYFKQDPKTLADMATAAAALGVERFVVDDGWFHGRRDDRAGLGDWWVDRDVFPEGLGPLAAHVRGLGMGFALWVEPEMVNPDSELFRAHPDWALQIDGRPHLTARNQLVLDLTRPAVFEHVAGRLFALLRELPIDALKWDHNRDLTAAGSAGRAAWRAQTQAAHRLFDAVREAFPSVEIEACAGGGGRIDAAMLRRAHRVWTSDNLDAVSRVAIQRGFLQFFPPEIMGAHIGAAPAHATGRGQSVDFRAGVAFGGHLGVELDPRALTDAHRDRIAAWIAAYKAARGTLHGGRTWLGEAGDGVVWQAQGAPDDAVVSIFRVEPTGERWAPRVRLPFLDPARDHRIETLGPPPKLDPAQSPFLADLLAGRARIHGAWAREIGLPLPFMKAQTALILRVAAL